MRIEVHTPPAKIATCLHISPSSVGTCAKRSKAEPYAACPSGLQMPRGSSDSRLSEGSWHIVPWSLDARIRLQETMQKHPQKDFGKAVQPMDDRVLRSNHGVHPA